VNGVGGSHAHGDALLDSNAGASAEIRKIGGSRKQLVQG
jgi:hypothetical protein